jgi:hypothetical protein
MTKAQFGFAAGFAFVALWAVTGFLIALGAVVAGLLVVGVVGLLEGRWSADEMVGRLSGQRR